MLKKESMRIVIYTKSYCPYCSKAKNLLSSKGLDFEEIDITDDQASMNEMIELSHGRKTVPQIFIDDKHIGGFDDLSECNNSGRLDEIIGM